LFYVPRFILTEAHRETLKRPLGELVTGTPSECNGALKNVIISENPKLVVLVGDTVSRNSVQSNIRADVIIIDNKEKRGKAAQFEHTGRHVFRTTNPAGTIDVDAWRAVDEAVRKGKSLVLVDGEEDLLTLVAIVAVPLGSLVVYGQPDQGIVIVRVRQEKKTEIQLVLDGMKREA
jgi:uncharacterized protein (UPF0218 family)